jgi:peptidoglycan/LPS O-acetylase OafA/YrhL
LFQDLQPANTPSLDGLRGVAAFFVVWHHASLVFWSWSVHRGWQDWNSYIIQLPFLRLVISGLPQVCIFFVVSGYSISLKSLKLSHQRRYAEVHSALASSVCRRHSRLFIPALTVSFISACWSHWGWYAASTWHGGVAIGARPPPRDAASFWGQMMDWSRHAIRHADPIMHNVNGSDGFSYDLNQWTMPVEFAGSMIVFLLLAAFSKFSPLVRLVCIFFVACWQLHITSYAVFLFVSGIFLADLRLYLTPPKAQSSPAEPTLGLDEESLVPQKSYSRFSSIVNRPVLKNAFWITSFIWALYVLSMPELRGAGGPAEPTPGYKTLAQLIPKQYWDAGRPDHFLIPLGAFWLVFTIDNSPLLQKIFTNCVAQYLGKISFSLYLVHGPVLYTLAAYLCPQFMAVTGTETDSQWGLGIFLVCSVFWPVAFWYADLATRFVDQQAVSMVRYVYERLAREI